MTENEARETIARTCREMYARFLFSGTDGNVSVRLPDGRIVTTPTGVSKGRAEADKMVVTDESGNVLSSGKPSSEIKLHLAVYAARKDINAIVHAHPSAATAFALAEKSPGGELTESAVMFPGGIPVAEFAVNGTAEIAENCVRALGSGYAVLLARHGAVTVGETLEDAQNRMDALENIAKTELLKKLLDK